MFISLTIALQYNGGREEQDFIDFLNDKCKTNRVSGGGISQDVNIFLLSNSSTLIVECSVECQNLFTFVFALVC